MSFHSENLIVVTQKFFCSKLLLFRFEESAIPGKAIGLLLWPFCRPSCRLSSSCRLSPAQALKIRFKIPSEFLNENALEPCRSVSWRFKV